MTRYPDWQTRLNAFLRRHGTRAFRYGSWDCCLFVCDAIQIMTGIDPATEFRGNYKSAKEALAVVRSICGSASVAAITERIAGSLGMRELPLTHARRGDVLLIRRSRGYSLGLMALDGRHALVAGANGVLSIPMNLAVRSWTF